MEKSGLSTPSVEEDEKGQVLKDRILRELDDLPVMPHIASKIQKIMANQNTTNK